MQKKNALFIVFIILITSFCFSSVFANEMRSVDLKAIHYGKPIKDNGNVNFNSYRDGTVNYEIVKEPTPITGQTTFYDYCPGGYWANPVAYQGGSYGWTNYYYMTYMQIGQPNGLRRQYYAACDHTSLDVGSNYRTITSYAAKQGFGSIDIHQSSGYCIASMHETYDGDELYELALCYDNLATLGVPGMWSSTTHFWNTASNEYIWPRIHVGPSPKGTEYVRVYQVSTNSAEDGDIVQKSDLKIDYIDVENSATPNFGVLLDTANWTTIKPLLYWVDDYRIRPDAHFVVNQNPGHEGEVAIIGTNYWNEDLTSSPVEKGLFVWESSLGEGPDFDLVFLEENLHTDGPTDFFYGVKNVIAMDWPNGYTPDSIYVDARGTHSTAKYDSDSKIHWIYDEMYYIPAEEEDRIYIYRFAYPQSEVTWDGEVFNFSHNQAFPYIDPWSGHDVPFTVDSTVTPPDTLQYFNIGFSLYEGSDGTPDCSQENLQQLATNFDEGNKWMAWLWVDGTYSALGSTDYVVTPDPQYEPYVEHPVIYISITNTNGSTWSVPIELTDLALEGINVYAYCCSKIKDIGDDWGQLVIYYMDDYVFNSSVSLKQPADAGAIIKYMVVNIDFSFGAVDPGSQSVVNSFAASNHPNPFFSSTTIQFAAKKAYKKASVNVYNTRGQLVNTLDVAQGNNPTEGYSVWNGKDFNNNDVANGIYFYKVDVDGISHVEKMMLVR